MKRTARNLLSLLMAITMLFSMIPTALAASYDYEDDDGIKWTDECEGGGDHDYYLSDCTSKYEKYECEDCEEKGRIEHDWVYDWDDDDYHVAWCSNEECEYYDDEKYEEHDYDEDGLCIYCEYAADYDVELEVEKGDDDSYYDRDDDSSVSVTASVWDNEEEEYVDAEDIDYYFTFDWEGDLFNDADDYDTENDDGESTAYLDTALDKCKVECTVSLYDEDDKLVDETTVSWTFYCSDEAESEIEVNAIVATDSKGLDLDSEDDAGNDSVEEQIADAVSELDYSLEYIQFSDISDNGCKLSAKTSRKYYYEGCDEDEPPYKISEVRFTPKEGFDGEVEFAFVAYCYDEDDDLVSVNGILVIEVTDDVDADTIEVSAAVASDTEKLYLDDEDDEGNDSVEDQIADAVSELDYSLEYIKFSNDSDNGGELNAKTSRKYYYEDCIKSNPPYKISDVYFTAEEDFDDEAEFEFIAYCYDEDENPVEVNGILIVKWADDVVDDTIEVTATVEGETEELYLNTKDEKGNDSIEDQIADAASELDYSLEYIKFYGVSEAGGKLNAKASRSYYYKNCEKKKPANEIADVYFTPATDYVGEAIFEFTAYCYNEDEKLVEVDGILTFLVDTDLFDPIYLTAVSGKTVALDEDLFVEFWKAAYPNGKLKCVSFTDISAGSVYDNYTSSSKKGTNMASRKAYLEPTSAQYGLNDLTYVPAKNTVSATIEFTATGTTKSTGNSTISATNSIVILYTKQAVTPITYNVRGFAQLNPTDFTDLYKDVMGASVAKEDKLEIKILTLPASGSLWMNSMSTVSSVYGMPLDEDGIEEYSFSASATAENKISRLAFSSAGTSASISYICYYNSVPKFVGSIEFKVQTIPAVNLSCTTMGTTFNTAAFFNNSDPVLTDAAYIQFYVPSSGTLYKNFTNGTGTKVTLNDKFAPNVSAMTGYTDINTVGFLPAGPGEATLSYRIYFRSGGFLPGTVKINVTAPVSFTDVPVGSYYYDAVRWAVEQGITYGTNSTNTTYSPAMTCDRGQVVTYLHRAAGSPKPKTTANPFVDVSPSDYYYEAVLWAVEQGYINGTSATTFSPKLECTYGMIVTLLWRFNGRPAVSYTGTEYYSQPIAWANSLNLLSGTTSAFSPTANSNRADIVTYMYRIAT